MQKSSEARSGEVRWSRDTEWSTPAPGSWGSMMNMGNCQLCAAGLAIPAYMAVLYNGPAVNIVFLSGFVGFLLLLVAALIWSSIQAGYLRVPKCVPLAIMGLWFGWLLVSTLWSYFPQMSWYYAWNIGAFPLISAFWLFQENGDQKWRRAFPWLLGVALLAAMHGIVQYVLTEKRIWGPRLDFNTYGALLYLFILALLPFCFNKGQAVKPGWRRHQGLLLASFTILCLALFATYSRGAIGVLALLCVPFYLFARRRYPGARKTALTLLVIAVSCYGAVKIYPQHTIDRNWDLGQDSSFQSRLLMWHSMLEIYEQHPLFGTGIATYKLFYHQFRSPEETSSSGDLGHNDYIQFLQEQGPIGLAFLLVVGLLALSVSWRLFRRRDDPADLSQGDSIGEAFGLSLGVMGLFMQASVNFIFYILPLSFLGGVFLAQAYRTARPLTYCCVRLPAVNRPVAALALVAVCGLPAGGLLLDGVIATVVLNQGNLPGVREISDNPEAVYRFAAFMQKLRPANIEPRMIVAWHNLSIALDESNPYLKRVAAAQAAGRGYAAVLKAESGHDAVALSDLAQLIAAFPDIARNQVRGLPSTPDDLLYRAIKYDPTYYPAYKLLAQRYESRGELRTALSLIVNRAFPWFAVPKGAQQQRIALMEKAVKLSASLQDAGRTRELARKLLEKDPGNVIASEALTRITPPALPTAS